MHVVGSVRGFRCFVGKVGERGWVVEARRGGRRSECCRFGVVGVLAGGGRGRRGVGGRGRFSYISLLT